MYYMARNRDFKTGNILNTGSQVVTNITDSGSVEGYVNW